MKVPSTGGKGGAPPPGGTKTQAPGGPRSYLKYSFFFRQIGYDKEVGTGPPTWGLWKTWFSAQNCELLHRQRQILEPGFLLIFFFRQIGYGKEVGTGPETGEF